MITDNKKWHYITIKSISKLFRGITSTNNDDFYCLNCFQSYRTKETLTKHELLCNNHHYCEIVLPEENKKILKYLQGPNSMKIPQAIYVDIECLLVKHKTCFNNPNKSFSQTVATHVPSGFAISVVTEFKTNYPTYYRVEDCMKVLSAKLLRVGKEISNEEKHDMILLTANEEKQYENAEVSHICKKPFINKEDINNNEDDNEDEKEKKRKENLYKIFRKVQGHCHYTGKHRGAAHSLCNLRYQEQRSIPVTLHNGSNYDFHLLMKELAKEFKSDRRCIGENTENPIRFSVNFHKDKKEENEENEDGKEACRLKFIDSFRFMNFSLDSLTDNLSEINNKTCEKYKAIEKCVQYCKFTGLLNNRLKYKCLNCKDISFKSIDPLIKNFSNTYRLCNNDNETFVLLLRKGVYPYEYMDNWNKFDETELPLKNEFDSNLNMSSISDKDYDHAKSVFNILNMTNLGDYHDLYVQSDTLLLSDIFEEFTKTCINQYGLEPCYFVSAPRLSWEACLKLTNVKLELLTDIDMLLMFEKGIKGGNSQAMHDHAKSNNKYMKSYDKKVTSSYLQYLDANNLYSWAMSKNLPISGFKWDGPRKNTEKLIKSYNEYDKYGAILEVDIEHPKELYKAHRDLPFLCDRKLLDKTNKLITSFEIKKSMLCIY